MTSRGDLALTRARLHTSTYIHAGATVLLVQDWGIAGSQPCQRVDGHTHPFWTA